MKRSGLVVSAALLVSVTAVSTAAAEPAPAITPPAPRVEILFDPVVFALRGYSVWVGLNVSRSWRVLIGSFSGDVVGEADGWEARIRSAPLVMLTRFFGDDHRGLYVGLGLGMFQWGISRTADFEVSSSFDQTVVTPIAGYRWFPSTTLGIYIEPFLAGGVPIFEVGSRSLGGERYEQTLASLFLPGVFVGWRF